MTSPTIIRDILAECDRAKGLHPMWPADVIHGAAIVAEEAGETVRAALDHVYFGKPLADVRKEAVQTAATCLRLLAAIDGEVQP